MTDEDMRLEQRLDWITQSHSAGSFTIGYEAEFNAAIITFEDEPIAVVPITDLNKLTSQLMALSNQLFLIGLIE